MTPTLSCEQLEEMLVADGELFASPGYDEAAWWRERGVEMGEITGRANGAWRVFERVGMETPDLQKVCSFFFKSGVRFGLLIADNKHNAKEVTEA